MAELTVEMVMRLSDDFPQDLASAAAERAGHPELEHVTLEENGSGGHPLVRYTGSQEAIEALAAEAVDGRIYPIAAKDWHAAEKAKNIKPNALPIGGE